MRDYLNTDNNLLIVPVDAAPEAVFQFLYDMLYADNGVDFEPGLWRSLEAGGEYICRFDDEGRVLGVVRLMPAQEDSSAVSRQVRQVAVDPAHRGNGIGRTLMRDAEERAFAQGAEFLWLEARSVAYKFYQNLGYQLSGEQFISQLTKIPHSKMEKSLSF